MLLRAVDRDSVNNGPPFHFTVPSEYRYSKDFYLQDNLNGTATLTALRMFDREQQKEFLIPVVMSDSGSPAKTITSTLTVTIGDQNDHPHMAGDKEIFINNHRGRKQFSILGLCVCMFIISVFMILLLLNQKTLKRAQCSAFLFCKSESFIRMHCLPHLKQK